MAGAESCTAYISAWSVLCMTINSFITMMFLRTENNPFFVHKAVQSHPAMCHSNTSTKQCSNVDT